MSAASTCGGCARQLRDAYLCAACTQRLAALYGELPGLVSELATTTYRQDRMVLAGGGSAPRGSRVVPMPFRWAASILLVDIQRDMTAIASRHGLIVVDGASLVVLCGALRGQLKRDAVSVPDIGRTLATLDDRAVTMRLAIDLPLTHRYLGRCEACGVELYADRTLTRFDCPTRGCGASYDVAARVSELLERSRAVVASAQTIVTALASLDLRVTEDQITKWRQRGRLPVIERVGPRQRAQYRVGDVLDLIAVSPARAPRGSTKHRAHPPG